MQRTIIKKERTGKGYHITWGMEEHITTDLRGNITIHETRSIVLVSVAARGKASQFLVDKWNEGTGCTFDICTLIPGFKGTVRLVQINLVGDPRLPPNYVVAKLLACSGGIQELPPITLEALEEVYV